MVESIYLFDLLLYSISLNMENGVHYSGDNGGVGVETDVPAGDGTGFMFLRRVTFP